MAWDSGVECVLVSQCPEGVVMCLCLLAVTLSFCLSLTLSLSLSAGPCAEMDIFLDFFSSH